MDIVNETGSTNANYTHGPAVDEPLARYATAGEYYLSDALGSVVGLTDSTGSVKTAYNYSAFGKASVAGSSSENAYKFTGREDDGNGLYYFRARYYSPEQKRFVGEDPAGLAGGDSNFYAYVGNDPINRSDPYGLSWQSFGQGVIDGFKGGWADALKNLAIGAAVATAFAAIEAFTAGAATPALAALSEFFGMLGEADLLAQLYDALNLPCPDARDYALGQLLGQALQGKAIKKIGGAVKKLAERIAGFGCSFAAGTAVTTEEGDKPIEQVKAGDKVLSRNERTGEQSYHRVLQTFATPDDEIYSLQLQTTDGKQETLSVTANHPFWLKGKGWTETDLLKSGDLIEAKDGKWLTVASVQPTQEKATGYNLEVETDHTYFVGNQQTLVHNACFPNGAPGEQAPNFVQPGVTNLKGEYNPTKRTQPEPYSAHYDEYGRQVGRTDYTDQPDPKTHTNPHHHTREYGPAYAPTGKETYHEGPHPLDNP